VTGCHEHPTVAVHVGHVDHRLAELSRRIDRLEGLAQVDAAVDASPRIRRDIGALQDGKELVLAAARRAPDDVEETIGLLQTRLAVAEHAAVADLSDDWNTFAAGVEDELRSWNAYLDRLQASIAGKNRNARGQADTAIGDVRTRRVAVYDELLHAGDRQARRERVAAARTELVEQADELSATACTDAWQHRPEAWQRRGSGRS
jgi:hypothetical protein